MQLVKILQKKKMNNRIFENFMLVLILSVLEVHAVFGQTFCTEPGTDQFKGFKDGYRYELWNQYSQGNACMTIGDGATFSGEWSDIENYLARRGLGYDQTQRHDEIGVFSSNFNCDYNPVSDKGNSYLSIYGWTVEPLIEYYIVEDWRKWNPSMSKDAVFKGCITIDGSEYDIYETTRTEQPSIQGITTFQQYFSIRKNKRDNGELSISEHFMAWEKLGMPLGKLHEVSFVVEGYHSAGSFDFKELEIIVE